MPLAFASYVDSWITDPNCEVGSAQVIPTVGVSGTGAESEKKVAAQLKHFRNLVDEKASKVRQQL